MKGKGRIKEKRFSSDKWGTFEDQDEDSVEKKSLNSSKGARVLFEMMKSCQDINVGKNVKEKKGESKEAVLFLG